MSSRPSRKPASAGFPFPDEAARLRVSSSSLLILRKQPFGRDPAGRALSFIAARLHGTARRKAVDASRPAALRFALALVRSVVFAHAAFVLATSLCLFVFRTVNPGATTLMVYRAVANGWTVVPPRYVPLARIPGTTRNMTVRVEDGTFFEHHGVVPAAIKHAYTLNKGFGEPIYGGSTITMQTARTIFLVPEKSYLRKYLEVIIALEMEALLGKNRILELYFNYAEWGKGVFGIEAAARAHYRAGVASLSRDQAIRLVTLLSSPIRYSPYNFGRNGILLSRYSYLVKRWGDPPPDPPEPVSEAAAGQEGAEAEGGAPQDENAGEVPADAVSGELQAGTPGSSIPRTPGTGGPEDGSE